MCMLIVSCLMLCLLGYDDGDDDGDATHTPYVPAARCGCYLLDFDMVAELEQQLLPRHSAGTPRVPDALVSLMLCLSGYDDRHRYIMIR